MTNRPPLNRDYNRDLVLERRGFINHGATLRLYQVWGLGFRVRKTEATSNLGFRVYGFF